MTEPGTAARELRRRLSVGETEPLDVLKCANDAGALVVLSPIDGGPAGMFAMRGDDAWIYVNTSDARPPLLGRLRFSIAHELGHWWLGHGGQVDEQIELGARGLDESQANAFAAEFLLPERAVAHVLGPSRNIGLDEVVALAARHGISCAFVVFRLHSLRYITASVKRKLHDACERAEHLRGARRQLQLEFADQLTLQIRQVDNDATVVVPRETAHRVEDLWEHGVLEDDEAAGLAHLEPNAFRRRMRQRGIERAAQSTDDVWW